MIHPKDKGSSNPRIQCVVGGKWMRLLGKKLDEETGKPVSFQRFYGGCSWNGGNDHLAAKEGDYDVCNNHCNIECKRIGAEFGIKPLN